jgi:hypothetical protein
MYSEMLCRSHIDYVKVPSGVQLSTAFGARYHDHAYFPGIFLDEISFEEDVNYSRVSTLSPKQLEYCWH